MITPLQKTIHNLAMNGGSVVLTEDKREDFEMEDYFDEDKFKKGAIWQVCGFAPSDLMIPLGEGYFEGFLFRNGSTYVNFKRGYLPLLHSFNKLTEKMPSGVTYIDYLWFEVVGTDSDCFNKQEFYEDCESGLINLLPIMVLNQLNAWFFNTENLPEDQFIEIETLKIK